MWDVSSLGREEGMILKEGWKILEIYGETGEKARNIGVMLFTLACLKIKILFSFCHHDYW